MLACADRTIHEKLAEACMEKYRSLLESFWGMLSAKEMVWSLATNPEATDVTMAVVVVMKKPVPTVSKRVPG
jgi:hypothetical protein